MGYGFLSKININTSFFNITVYIQVLSPNAIAVKVPQSPRAGEVDITLVFKGSQYCITNPGKFNYLSKIVFCNLSNVYL